LDGSAIAVAFYSGGQKVLTRNGAGTARLCGIPPPAADEPERLRLSVKVRTGSEFDEKSGTIKSNTVQLFKGAGTFHVPRQQENNTFRGLADGTRSVPATC